MPLLKEVKKVFDKKNITKRRRVIQTSFLILYFLFPLLNIFYIDLEASKFILFGKTIGINNSIIFMVGFLVLLFSVITMSVLTGRSFCGWICPQNFLSEMINKVINKYVLDKLGNKKKIQNIFIHSIAVIIALAVALNFTFYFGKPIDVINNLISLNLNSTIFVFAIFFFIIVYSGLGIFRHDFCKYGCPYGIAQAVVSDKTTLRVRFEKERSYDCIDCNACADLCYMDIEPRKLTQSDPGCMNCGLCVEACHQILKPIKRESMLTFIKDTDEEKNNINSKALYVLPIGLTFLIGIFLYLFLSIKPINLNITNDESFTSILNNKNDITSKYKIELINQDNKNKIISLNLKNLDKKFFEFSKNNFKLNKGEKAEVDLKIEINKNKLNGGIYQYKLLVKDETQKILNKEDLVFYMP